MVSQATQPTPSRTPRSAPALPHTSPALLPLVGLRTDGRGHSSSGSLRGCGARPSRRRPRLHACFPRPGLRTMRERTCRGRSRHGGAGKPDSRGHDQHHPLLTAASPEGRYHMMWSWPNDSAGDQRPRGSRMPVQDSSYRSSSSASAAKCWARQGSPFPGPGHRAPRTGPSSALPASGPAPPAEPLRTGDGFTGRKGSLGAASQPGPGRLATAAWPHTTGG